MSAGGVVSLIKNPERIYAIGLNGTYDRNTITIDYAIIQRTIEEQKEIPVNLKKIKSIWCYVQKQYLSRNG